MSKLDDNFDKLVALIGSRNEHDVREWDRVLTEIAASNDVECVSRLALLLEDDEELEELMFSIVHMIEAFNHELYIEQVLSVLPKIWISAPRWTLIIHIRIFNSETAFIAYLSHIVNATDAQKRITAQILESLHHRDARFTERIAMVSGRLDRK